MSFFIYDITFLLIFITSLVLFLYPRRKKIDREGLIILYRTKLGIKIINFIGKKYKKFLNVFGYFVIFVGYLLMLGGLYLIFQLVYIFVRNPDLFKIVKIPPFAPLVPYLPQLFKAEWLPPFYFTYWIVVLAITAVFHEFAHGIFAKAHDLKIKSTGFAFLGPFAGAFVEPDEKKMQKKKIPKQLSILAAGSFANVVVSILTFIFFILFFISFFQPVGLGFNTYVFTQIDASEITQITDNQLNLNFDGELNLTQIYVDNETYYITNENLENIDNLERINIFDDSPALNAGLIGAISEIDGNKIESYDGFVTVLESKQPGDEIEIKTVFDDSIKTYEIELAGHPNDKSKAYLGIALPGVQESGSFASWIREKVTFFRDPYIVYEPGFAEDFILFIYNLIWWLLLVNISVALVNMLPLGIFDGGRVFYLSVLGLTKSKKAAKIAYKFATYFLLFLFLLLTYIWFMGIF